MRPFRPAGAEGEDDAALLRAVAAGSQAALGVLYDRHAGWLLARLTRRCADPEAVREALQDTFVTVWRSAGGYPGGQACGGWLWVIAARRLVDVGRARARHERIVYERPAAAESAEELVLAGLEYGDVGTAFDRLSPQLRDVLRATVVDGLTTREAAVLLGVPEGTVKTRARRARRELRALLTAPRRDAASLGGPLDGAGPLGDAV